MPKRTNDFQALVAHVYRQITGDKGKVTESGEVYDRDAKILREVDILVEFRSVHHDFALMLECRDRSRKDSVQWIDELIGKSKSLAVDKVVAVSNRGFSQTAVTKAAANDIDAIALEEALDEDWSTFPVRPGLALVTDERFSLRDVQYQTGDKFRTLSELGMDSVVMIAGEAVGSVRDTFEAFFHKVLIPQLQTEVSQDRPTLFRSRQDLEKQLYAEWTGDFPDFSVRTGDGDTVRTERIRFVVLSERKVIDADLKHSKLNDVFISTAKHIDTDRSEIDFRVVQDPEEKQVHLHWERRPPDESEV